MAESSVFFELALFIECIIKSVPIDIAPSKTMASMSFLVMLFPLNHSLKTFPLRFTVCLAGTVKNDEPKKFVIALRRRSFLRR